MSLVQDPSDIPTALSTRSQPIANNNGIEDSSVSCSESENESSCAKSDYGDTYRSRKERKEDAQTKEFVFESSRPFNSGFYFKESLLSPPPWSYVSTHEPEQDSESDSSRKRRRSRKGSYHANIQRGKVSNKRTVTVDLNFFVPHLTISKTNDKQIHVLYGGKANSFRSSSRCVIDRTNRFRHCPLLKARDGEALNSYEKRRTSSKRKSLSMSKPQSNQQITTFNTSSSTTVTTAVTTTTARATAAASTTTTTAVAATTPALASATYTSLHQQAHTIRKEETFVVTDWQNITGEDRSPSENLRRRKALTLAKSNARNLLRNRDQQRTIRNQIEQQQQQQHRNTHNNQRREILEQQANYSHYNFLSRELQLQLHQQQRQQQNRQQKQQQQQRQHQQQEGKILSKAIWIKFLRVDLPGYTILKNLKINIL